MRSDILFIQETRFSKTSVLKYFHYSYPKFYLASADKKHRGKPCKDTTDCRNIRPISILNIDVKLLAQILTNQAEQIPQYYNTQGPIRVCYVLGS